MSSGNVSMTVVFDMVFVEFVPCACDLDISVLSISFALLNFT